MRQLNKRTGARKQQGAAAVEFALLFLLFFALFYALVSYAIAMLLQQSFVHAAEEGARSAIAVDSLAYTSSAAYRSGVEPRVRTVVGAALSWLPAKAKTQVLGTNNGNVQLTWTDAITSNTLKVQVVYTGYTANPMLPILTLPFIGDVPKLPTDLAGIATIGL